MDWSNWSRRQLPPVGSPTASDGLTAEQRRLESFVLQLDSASGQPCATLPPPSDEELAASAERLFTYPN